MGRNVSQNHPPTGGNGGLLLGFYCCVYHIHVHIAAPLVLEDDDVLQAHDLLATHQVPKKIRANGGRASQPIEAKALPRPNARRSGAVGRFRCLQTCGRNQELAALTIRIAFIVIQFPASLF